MVQLMKPVSDPVQNWKVPATLAIAVGDLMYDSGSGVAKPAGQQTDELTEPGNQCEFHNKFIGVSNGQRLVTQTDTPTTFPILTDILIEMTCTSSAFEIGDLVGACEAGSGTALENQKVKKVSDWEQAIGTVVQRYGSAVTKVWVRLCGKGLDLYARRLAERDACIKVGNGAGAAVVVGSAVYLLADGTGAAKADCNGSAPARNVCGLVRAGQGATGGEMFVQQRGLLTLTTAEWDAVTGDIGGLVPETEYYLSATAGGVVKTVPATTGDNVVVIGTGVSTTVMNINIRHSRISA